MGFSLKRLFKPPRAIRKLKPLKLLGKVGGIAAPILAATGVGLPLAAGIGAASGLLKGKGLKGALVGAGTAAAGGLAGRALGTTGLLRGGGGLRGVLGRAKDIVRAAPGRLSTAVLGRARAGGGREGGVLGEGGLAERVGGPLPLAQLGLGAVSAYQGARARSAQAKALERATGALGPGELPLERPSLAAEFADVNPYSRPIGTNRARRAAERALAGG